MRYPIYKHRHINWTKSKARLPLSKHQACMESTFLRLLDYEIKRLKTSVFSAHFSTFLYCDFWSMFLVHFVSNSVSGIHLCLRDIQLWNYQSYFPTQKCFLLLSIRCLLVNPLYRLLCFCPLDLYTEVNQTKILWTYFKNDTQGPER